MTDCLQGPQECIMTSDPPDHCASGNDGDNVIEEVNLQEQQDEMLTIRSMFEGSDEERIKIISEPDEHGHGLFRIMIKIPVSAPSETLQINLMMPVNENQSPLKDDIESSKNHPADAVRSEEESQLKTFEPENKAEPESEAQEAEEAGAFGSFDDETELEGASAGGKMPFLDLGSGVALQRSLSGQRWLGSFSVHYLSPITLQLTLPPSYPFTDPPAFVLTCAWLRNIQLSALCKKLDQIWEGMPHIPIIYAWLDFLENEAFSFLGLNSDIILMPDNTGGEGDNIDDRAMSECQDMGQAVHCMLQYNQQKDAVEFCKSMQECSLCFDEKIGGKFFRLDPCKHHFCYDCIATHCNMHVTEGTVHLLTCPGFKCKTIMPPGLLQNLLSQETFIRWETLTLQRTLDEMDDVVYCPRCQSVVIREQDEALKLGHCLNCYYSFCTQCEQPWHQGSQCMTELDLLDIQEKRVQGRDQRAQDRFRELRRQAEERAQTYISVKSTTKKCPKCKIPVEKNGGCNKMICRCGQYFCWICGGKIQGYDHFTKTVCKLFNYNMEPLPRVINRPRAPDALLWMQAQAEVQDPAGQLGQIRCVQCKQTNYKLQNNNHIKCWNCKANNCFVCKSRITGVITKHFVPGGCPQHS